MGFASTFFVFGDPQPKGSHKGMMHVRGPYRSTMVVRMTQAIASVVGTPWEARALTLPASHAEQWERQIKLVASTHKPAALLDGAVRLSLRFVLSRPKSVSEAKRPHHIVKPDRDKLERAVTDALTGVIYVDDSRVVGGEVTKEYGDRPGVEVTVEELC